MSVDLVWPFLLIGLASGGLYALLGCGVVLAHRASGDLHIAHAGVALLGALAFVITGRWLPVGVALLAAVVVGAVTSTLLHVVVLARLEHASMAAKVTVSVACGIGLQAIGGLLLVNFDLLSGGPRGGALFSEATRLTVFGASVSAQQLALPIAALLVLGILQVGLHRTDLGLALRASSQNASSAALAGVPATAITRTAWAVTGVLAGLAGALSISSASFLVPTYLFAETIRGLAAALTGAFLDLKRTVAAAFVLGILEQQLVGFSPPWNAMRGALSFALITVVAVFGLARQLERSPRAAAA